MDSSCNESVESLTETVHLSHLHGQGLAVGPRPNLTLANITCSVPVADILLKYLATASTVSQTVEPYLLVSKLSVFFRSTLKINFRRSHSIDSKHRRFAAQSGKKLYAMFPIVSFVNSQQQFLPYRSEAGNLCRRAQISARAHSKSPCARSRVRKCLNTSVRPCLLVFEV